MSNIKKSDCVEDQSYPASFTIGVKYTIGSGVVIPQIAICVEIVVDDPFHDFYIREDDAAALADEFARKINDLAWGK